MRHAARTDANQQAIMDALRKIGVAGAYGQEVIKNPLYDASDPESQSFVTINRRRTRDLPMSGDSSMANLITQLYAFGNERGVKWTDPKEVAERKAWERIAA